MKQERSGRAVFLFTKEAKGRAARAERDGHWLGELGKGEATEECEEIGEGSAEFEKPERTWRGEQSSGVVLSSADPNTGLHHGFHPSSRYNRRILSFDIDVANRSAEMASRVICDSTVNYSTARNFLSGSSIVGNSIPGTPFNIGHREIVHGLKHDSGLAAEWTCEEQNLLNEGLIRFAGETRIIKYVKIAALFPNKTVRDVALRMRWLEKHGLAKRHKLEEHYAGRRIVKRNEKLPHSYSSRNVHILHSNSMPYSPMTHPVRGNNSFSCEGSPLDGTAQQLMDDTTKFLSQIATNIESLQNLNVSSNVQLFSSMRYMPGIMSQMPPLPISVNDELLREILPNASQAQELMFGLQAGINVKHEPSGSSLLL
ncbi:hypothetical protein AXF42_Ash013297 [Apostasia shenzhenica]|uniref:Myb-like domain-containing protein n=1 Tax=Apostasia shenzhenica TaxID=1088818 RepID=A0A2I0BBK5_9ASPA|nr:hypothetical protein AXF42_Ash013297 [Apostasia shenzhenica]